MSPFRDPTSSNVTCHHNYRGTGTTAIWYKFIEVTYWLGLIDHGGSILGLSIVHKRFILIKSKKDIKIILWV